MSTAASTQLGPVSAYVRRRVAELLDHHRVVVWYDAEQAFGELVQRLELSHAVVVSASTSELRARREAELVYRNLDDPESSAQAGVNLLIYVPRPRGSTVEQ